MHHVGTEPLHRGAQAPARLQPDAEVGVERQVRPAGAGDREAGVRPGAGGCDQLGRVPLGGEVLEHPSDRVGDAVDLGQEGLGDDQDTEPGIARTGDREGEEGGRCGAAVTPPLEQVHVRDARKRAATDGAVRTTDT
ncbi:hypothetical protein GCM10011376_19870 [Nocardioides flavus (ex Wang et al. 2016)]|uniref:Uncharacterized protein n=1 Tax=Nocardioides flavus (ex Wang et al. 2016) TaxID=2058780 RepID=A0ABQ3HL35_9ACTN|nr:hypothetical protein GCM10011376_19870 [Nocardioides flavus (ex Wang et al. 2016)]